MNLEIRLEPHASPRSSKSPSATVHLKLVHDDGSTAQEWPAQSIRMNLDSRLVIAHIDVSIREHGPAEAQKP